MLKRGAKPKTKCKITMEMTATGDLRFVAVKGANSIVSREEANRFLTEAREWLDKLATVSWNGIYEKEVG